MTKRMLNIYNLYMLIRVCIQLQGSKCISDVEEHSTQYKLKLFTIKLLQFAFIFCKVLWFFQASKKFDSEKFFIMH